MGDSCSCLRERMSSLEATPPHRIDRNILEDRVAKWEGGRKGKGTGVWKGRGEGSGGILERPQILFPVVILHLLILA